MAIRPAWFWPASVEDCFYTAIEAVNIAREYSTPVIILTDQAIATRIEAFGMPKLKDVSGHLTGPHPARGSQTLRSISAGRQTHAAPGTYIKSVNILLTGLEHNEMGIPAVPGNAPGHERRAAANCRPLVAPSPSRKCCPKKAMYCWLAGAVLRQSARGHRTRAQGGRQRVRPDHPSHQSSARWFEDIFAGFNHVYVVENNDEGLYGRPTMRTVTGQILRSQDRGH